MGLDQYASIRKDGQDDQEIAYWRKHPNLQGWMEQLWREKGGEGEFNCVDVELTLEDLLELKQNIQHGELPETKGFFFGSDADDLYYENDMQFLNDACVAIDKGYKVIYTSWW